MTSDLRLLLVGCGKMGGALLRGITAAKLASAIHVIEPVGAPEALKKLPGVSWHTASAELDPAFEPAIVILAVKPQAMATVLPAYTEHESLFLSIAAGVPLARLELLLGGAGRPVIRAMPNLPASIGQGISVAVPNRNVTAAQRALGDAFLSALGPVAWVEDEALLDAVTALSGSGPAYLFALCEAMAKAGESLGLSPELADRLARQTVIGSAALLSQSSESLEASRHAVTSPGGTTEAALKHLLASGGLFDLMKKAMQAAADISRGIGALIPMY